MAKPTHFLVTNLSSRRITLDLSEPTKTGIKPRRLRLGAVMDKALKDAEPVSTTITAADYDRLKETGGLKDLVGGKQPSLTVAPAAAPTQAAA